MSRKCLIPSRRETPPPQRHYHSQPLLNIVITSFAAVATLITIAYISLAYSYHGAVSCRHDK